LDLLQSMTGSYVKYNQSTVGILQITGYQRSKSLLSSSVP
jgi:hypothetical protein